VHIARSIEDGDGRHCVDLIQNDDGTYSFKEFRRDVEDGGRWTLTRDFSATRYDSLEAALAAAARVVRWLGD